MIKVLPFDLQAHLETVDHICKKRILILLPGNSKSHIKIFYSAALKIQDGFFNHGINRNEYKSDNLKFDSVRLWMQFLENMRGWYASYIGSAVEIETENDNEKWLILYRDFQTHIYKFTKSLLSKQLVALTSATNLYSLEDGSFCHGKLLNSDFFQSKNNPFCKIQKEGAWNDPDKLLYIPKSNLVGRGSSRDLKKKISTQCSAEERFLLKLFVFDNYYDTSHKRYLLLYAGKFIEFVFSIIYYKYLKNGKYNYANAVKDNRNVLDKRPLYANIDIQKTHPSEKMGMNEEEDLDTEFESNFTSVEDEEIESILQNYSISEKQDKDKKKDEEDEEKDDDKNPTEPNILDCLSQRVFLDTHFMHSVLNRFFNNLNIYRERVILESETPLKYMQRCAYMLLNAIGACELPNNRKSAFQNIAIMDDFSQETLFAKDNAYSLNIKPFIDEDSDIYNESSLTYIFRNHPVIKLLLDDTGKLSELSSWSIKEDNFKKSASAVEKKANYALRVKNKTSLESALKIIEDWIEADNSGFKKSYNDADQLIKQNKRGGVWLKKVRKLFENSSNEKAKQKVQEIFNKAK